MGASGCWNSSEKIPSSMSYTPVPKLVNQMLASTFSSTEGVVVDHVILPEFIQTCHLNQILSVCVSNTLSLPHDSWS